MDTRTDQRTLVGRLVEVTTAHFVAQLISEDDGFVPEITLGKDTVRVGQVGSYMLVVQAGFRVLVMIESMWQEQAAADETLRMLRMSPLGELNRNDDFSRGVTHYPTTGAELHIVTAETLARLFAEVNKGNYKVGKLSAFESIDVFFDASAFFGRHVAILGQSGSGKSWSVTSLIQSTLKAMPNAHMILLDLHGEYGYKKSDLSSHSVFPKNLVRYIDADELEIPYWLLSFSELVDLLIDLDDEDAAVQIAFLRNAVLELKIGANQHLGLGHISVDTPIYFPLTELYKRFKESNEQTAAFGKAKTALFGKFDQLLIKLQSRMNDTRYDFLLNPKKRTSSDTLSELMRDFVGLGKTRAKITVIDLSAIPFDLHATVTSQIGRLAFEFNYWNPRCKEFPIFLICEEAHSYITREGSDQNKQSRKAMERIAKAGRKYGVGLCVVSQRPHELSETVLSQCSSFVCLRISNPDDQAYVRELVPDAARGMLEALPALAQGEAIAVGEAVPLPLRLKITMPDPPPNSSSIDYAGQWARGPEEVSVEDMVDRWRRQRH
jgi:DNA helicase HerA-like ATPase